MKHLFLVGLSLVMLSGCAAVPMAAGAYAWDKLKPATTTAAAQAEKPLGLVQYREQVCVSVPSLADKEACDKSYAKYRIHVEDALEAKAKLAATTKAEKQAKPPVLQKVWPFSSKTLDTGATQ